MSSLYKRLYMADLDGTILPKGDKLPQDVVKTLNALISRGLPFTLNTSRTPHSIAPVLKDLHLSLPIILMNGACVYDTKTGKVSAINTINSVTAATVLTVCKKEGMHPFLFDYRNQDVSVEYTELVTDAEKEFYNDRQGYYKNFKKVTDYSPSTFTPYIICVGEKAKLKGLIQKLSNFKNISCTLFVNKNEQNCFLEIYAKSAGKANAAKRFMQEYGFTHLTAFGDNLNDIDMLKTADLSIAVGNAWDEVKAIADTVIGSCDESAVTEWLSLEWARNPEMV